jgi:transposase
MSGKAAKVKCTEKQMEVLEQIIKSPRSEVRLVARANIIWHAFYGKKNGEISDIVKLDRGQVGVWRLRWKRSFDALVAIECCETFAQLVRSIEEVLSDAPRSGRPPTFTPEQVTQILAVACEDPALSNRPISLWTRREITDEAIKRKIVDGISVSQVGRYLDETALQPHRTKYWLNTKEKDPVKFQSQVELVCQTYMDANRLFFQENTHTICLDEMPSLQAIERNGKTTPAQPNQPIRIEYEYTRHGTTCLIGNWDVVNGQMISPTISATRTEADLAMHVAKTVATAPDASWIIVVDCLNVHCSESMVRLVAKREGIDASTLGKKGKSGILKSIASRMEFLSQRTHRIRFVYLPKHSSWLNQIEIVFGIIQRRVIRHGNFRSLEALEDKLSQFINYFNSTFAKPFNWTYTGRPTNAKMRPRPLTWKESWAKARKDRQTLALAA